MSLSLMSIMRNDPDFGVRIAKKVEEVKKDKQNILAAADEYGGKYKNEILEGTELRNRLLTEGNQRGLSEEEVISSYGRFVPTIYTPILNLLYFMLRESDVTYDGKYQKRDKINEYLVKTKQLESTEDISESEMDSILDDLERSIHTKTKSHPARVEVNKIFNSEKKTRPKEEEVSLKETPEMVEYLYGNITLDVFNKIKKLKALSKSPNEEEAFMAYRKANELCKQYNLDFDRIPCYCGNQEK